MRYAFKWIIINDNSLPYTKYQVKIRASDSDTSSLITLLTYQNHTINNEQASIYSSRPYPTLCSKIYNKNYRMTIKRYKLI